jgi:C4-dicarboxylate transporter DctM subunit
MGTALALIVAIPLGLLGVPVGASFIMGALIAATIIAPKWLLTFPTVMLRPFDSFTLLAVPLFIAAAEFILLSGVGDTLVRAAARVIRDRFLPAGVVGIGVFFSGITGSSVAETSALGRLLVPLMSAKGFRKSDVAGLMAVTATLGVLIPPSIPMIIYSLITETPISRLFLGGVIPALLFGISLAIAAVCWVRQEAPATDTEDAKAADLPRRGGGRGSLLLALFLPALMLGGIYGGLGTPTEVAALVALYAGILMLTFDPARWRINLFNVGSATAQATSALFFILIGTMLISNIATVETIPQRIAQWIVQEKIGKWEFLIFLNLLLLVLGTIVDGLSMILLVVPLFFPTARSLGIDPVHLGVIITVNIEIGLIHPPVGLNLFAISSVSGVPVGTVVRRVLKYYPLVFALLMIVTFVPWVSVGAWR